MVKLTAKTLFSLLLWQLSLMAENPYSSKPEYQGNQLTKFQVKPITIS